MKADYPVISFISVMLAGFVVLVFHLGRSTGEKNIESTFEPRVTQAVQKEHEQAFALGKAQGEKVAQDQIELAVQKERAQAVKAQVAEYSVAIENDKPVVKFKYVETDTLAEKSVKAFLKSQPVPVPVQGVPQIVEPVKPEPVQVREANPSIRERFINTFKKPNPEKEKELNRAKLLPEEN